jgi:hypothetical protein
MLLALSLQTPNPRPVSPHRRCSPTFTCRTQTTFRRTRQRVRRRRGGRLPQRCPPPTNPAPCPLGAAHWVLNRLAFALETALNTASSYQQQQQRQQPPGAAGAPPQQPHHQPASPSSNAPGGRQRVFSVTLVRGTPFYGYHAGAPLLPPPCCRRAPACLSPMGVPAPAAPRASRQRVDGPLAWPAAGERVWAKVLLYNPRDVGRAADLLRVGALHAPILGAARPPTPPAGPAAPPVACAPGAGRRGDEPRVGAPREPPALPAPAQDRLQPVGHGPAAPGPRPLQARAGGARGGQHLWLAPPRCGSTWLSHCVAPLLLCRAPLPPAFTRQRRGWATRQLVVESEPGADSLLPQGAGQAGTPGSSASQSQRLWTAANTPSAWLWAAGGSGGPARATGGRPVKAPPRQSSCQLELDAAAEHILNRQQARGCTAAPREGSARYDTLLPLPADHA